MTTCLSDLRLDELLAGELAGDDATATERHLGECARCRTRHTALVADRAQFRAALRPLTRKRTAWHGPALAAGAVALAASAALVVRTPDDGTRSKGGARLGFVVVRGDVMRAGGPGERVHPGDTLSFLVTSARPSYVAVLGRDAAGRVSVYFPSGDRAERVAAGRDLQLPQAVVLDGTLGHEQLYGVFCAAPVALAALRDATGAGQLEREPPEGCTVDRLAIEKLP